MTHELHPAFANIEAQRHFTERHKEFVECLGNLREASKAADITGRMPFEDIVFYSLARMVIEDFNEIVMLSANGSTTGAMKILRGMFERTVTACYLHAHPEETNAFIGYFPVSQYKAAMRVKEDLPDVLTDEVIERIKEEYNSVKEKYRIPFCKKCGNTGINFSWTRKDIITMAKEVGDFEATIHAGYYTPMTETHSTMGAVIRRIRFDESEISFTYEYGVKASDEDSTLLVAHFLLLRILDTFRSHFNLQALAKYVERCCEDYLRVWKGPEEGIKMEAKSNDD